MRLVVVERVSAADPRLLDRLDVGGGLVVLQLGDAGTEERRVDHLVVGIADLDEADVLPVAIDVAHGRVEVARLGVALTLGITALGRLVVAHGGVLEFLAEGGHQVPHVGGVGVVADDQADPVLRPVLAEHGAGGGGHLLRRLVRGGDHHRHRQLRARVDEPLGRAGALPVVDDREEQVRDEDDAAERERHRQPERPDVQVRDQPRQVPDDARHHQQAGETDAPHPGLGRVPALRAHPDRSRRTFFQIRA